MESAIALIIAAGMGVGLAVIFGYLMEKVMGAAVLGGLALVGSSLCLIGAGGGMYMGGETGAWIGLLGGMVISGIFLGVVFRMMTRVARSGWLAMAGWMGYWTLSIVGYQAGSWPGLLTITLVAVLLFWFELSRLSRDVLPLRDERNRTERRQAFRSLITSTLGTNYPYYFVDKDGQLVNRVEGNSFLKFFAGPGFVITDSHHAAYVTDGIHVKGVFEPGLTFTGKYDMEPRLVDLRPQLRAFPVEALTKDGIPIKVVTFVPYRIDTRNQAVELGSGFPFRQSAVYQALASEIVERKPDKADRENGKKYRWDGGPEDGLIPLLATPIVQDVISRYNIDELCAPFDPDQDPRVKIAGEIRAQVKDILRERGLEMIGGGISNLMPQDEKVLKRRIDNWQTRWAGQILTQLSHSQAYRMNQLELARAKSEIETIRRFGQIIKSNVKNDLHRTLILGLIDSIRDVVGDKGKQWHLPNKEINETLKRLRGEL